MAVETHNVSREANDGSRTDIQNNGYDEQKYEHQDSRADTETEFHLNDIDALDVSHHRKRQLRRMHSRQEGNDYGEGTTADRERRDRKTQNREEWKRRVITTYSARLDMVPAQRDRAEHIFTDVLDFTTFGTYTIEQIAVGTIATVAAEDGWHVERNHTFRSLMNDCELTTDGDVEYERIQKLKSMVRERTPSLAD